MTQTMDLPPLKPAYLFAPEIQDKAKQAAERMRRLAPMIRLRLDAEKESAQLDREFVPEPTPRTFTRSQLESGFANYPEKAKPGPQPERKANYKGERRTWTRGGKQSNRKGQRQSLGCPQNAQNAPG